MGKETKRMEGRNRKEKKRKEEKRKGKNKCVQMYKSARESNQMR
jgi:hypothetical protein